jgi:hypothetical protein
VNTPTDKIADRNPRDAIREEDNDLLHAVAGAVWNTTSAVEPARSHWHCVPFTVNTEGAAFFPLNEALMVMPLSGAPDATVPFV